MKRTTGPNTYHILRRSPRSVVVYRRPHCILVPKDAERSPEKDFQRKVTCRGTKMHMRRLKLKIHHEKPRTGME
ncbi:hypothetical protein EVAR_74853_1 [Eumeta japonica]|uniref:Uncharacterized protein n=1 Tax=Eumeta variegata TaxID=151549 RepID=A0A4C1SQ79_EUMVA|nr:hypothetical protein EVAR_74853_1 [Eumeta japonica]